MKKILLAAFLVLGSVTLVEAQTAPAAAQNPNGPQFKFKGTEFHDFGTITEREEPYEHKFEFTNTGKAPLVIQNVTAGCGCTTPKWDNKPILPGKSSVITVQYNSKGRVSPFTKELFIMSNATPKESPYTLRIKGTVVAPK